MSNKQFVITNAGASSARLRQREFDIKKDLRVYNEGEITDMDNLCEVQFATGFETGVDKAEEDEKHLQEVLKASTALSVRPGDSKAFIPTPDASKVWEDYSKYYKADYSESENYQVQTATVEDASGCPYNMDEEDVSFLKELNVKFPEPRASCSEDEFEMIMYLLEKTVHERQPFLSMDLHQIMSYKELETVILEEVSNPSEEDKLLALTKARVYTRKYIPNPFRTVTKSFKTFGTSIYEHFKARIIKVEGKSIVPNLKLETSLVGHHTNDNDPYLCFRQREMLKPRKTRRTDQRSSERLRKLYDEMDRARRLFEKVAEREKMRLQMITCDKDIFEQQCHLKAVKRKLVIEGDDDDLLNLLKKKVKPKREDTEAKEHKSKASTNNASAAAAAAAAASSSASATSASHASSAREASGSLKAGACKIPDLDLVTLEQTLAAKKQSDAAQVKSLLEARSAANKDFMDYTDNPLTPYADFFLDEKRELVEEDRLAARNFNKARGVYSSLEWPNPGIVSAEADVGAKDRWYSPGDASPHVIWSRINNNVRMKPEYEASVFVPGDVGVRLKKLRGVHGEVFVDRHGVVQQPKEVRNPQTPADERLRDRNLFDVESTSQGLSELYREPAQLKGMGFAAERVWFSSNMLAKSYESLQHAQMQRHQHMANLRRRQVQVQSSEGAPHGTGPPAVRSEPPQEGGAINGGTGLVRALALGRR